MSDNKDLLNDLVDLRIKKENKETTQNNSIENQSKMEDLVPVVNLNEEDIIKEELEKDLTEGDLESISSTEESDKTPQTNNTSNEETKKTMVVLSKKDKFRKFLNLKEKQTKQQLEDIEAKQAKKYAWLAYILFFIPLFINRKNSFVKFHANEALEINLIDIIALAFILVGALVKPVSLLTILLVVLGCGLLCLTLITKIIMIIQTIRGKRKQSPWFFNLTIIE